MPEETNKKKSGGRGVENTLGIIGSVLDLAGPLLLGPDAVGMQFGAPFRAGAQIFSRKREQDTLLDALGSNPETAPLLQLGQQASDAGGLLNVLGSMQQGPQIAGQPAAQVAPQAGVAPAKPSVDITGLDFIRQIAQGDPRFAKKLILSQTKGDTEMDSIKQILTMQLLGKKLGGFETPAQKREASTAAAKAKEGRLTKQQKLQNLNTEHTKTSNTLKLALKDGSIDPTQFIELQSQLDAALGSAKEQINVGLEAGTLPGVKTTPTKKWFGMVEGKPKISLGASEAAKAKGPVSMVPGKSVADVVKQFQQVNPGMSKQQATQEAKKAGRIK